jgi:hypothetical protein
VCWIIDQKIDGAGGLHSCMCGEAQGIMEAGAYRMLYRSAVHLVWTSFTVILGLKLNWEAPGIGLGVFYSVSRMERQNPASTRFVIDCSRTPVPWNRFAGRGLWRRLI